MEVAVLISRDDGLRDGKVGNGLLAGIQVLLLVTGGGFQEDPMDVSLLVLATNSSQDSFCNMPIILLPC